jgi:hypothetical protein
MQISTYNDYNDIEQTIVDGLLALRVGSTEVFSSGQPGLLSDFANLTRGKSPNVGVFIDSIDEDGTAAFARESLNVVIETSLIAPNQTEAEVRAKKLNAIVRLYLRRQMPKYRGNAWGYIGCRLGNTENALGQLEKGGFLFTALTNLTLLVEVE